MSLRLMKAIFQFPLGLTQNITVFFSTTSNYQNCKSNQLYLFLKCTVFSTREKKKINIPTPTKVSHLHSVALKVQLGHHL